MLGRGRGARPAPRPCVLAAGLAPLGLAQRVSDGRRSDSLALLRLAGSARARAGRARRRSGAASARSASPCSCRGGSRQRRRRAWRSSSTRASPLEFRASAASGPLGERGAALREAARSKARASAPSRGSCPTSWPSRGGRCRCATTPGNAYLQALAETGAVGLLADARPRVRARPARRGRRWRRSPDAPARSGLRRGPARLSRRAPGGLALVRAGRRLSLLSARRGRRAPGAAGAVAPRAAAAPSRGLLVAVYAAAALWAAARDLRPDDGFRLPARHRLPRPGDGTGRPLLLDAAALRDPPPAGETMRLRLAHYTPEGRDVELTAEADGRARASPRLAPGPVDSSLRLSAIAAARGSCASRCRARSCRGASAALGRPARARDDRRVSGEVGLPWSSSSIRPRARRRPQPVLGDARREVRRSCWPGRRARRAFALDHGAGGHRPRAAARGLRRRARPERRRRRAGLAATSRRGSKACASGPSTRAASCPASPFSTASPRQRWPRRLNSRGGHARGARTPSAWSRASPRYARRPRARPRAPRSREEAADPSLAGRTPVAPAALRRPRRACRPLRPPRLAVDGRRGVLRRPATSRPRRAPP